MTGTFTYAPNSSDATTKTIGRIRLLIGDTEQNEASFSDEDIAAFLDMTGSSLTEAAAVAYETWARNQAKIGKMIEEGPVKNEREAIDALLKAAKAIRDSNIGTGRRIATNLNTNDGGYKANVRPLGNIKQDTLEEV